MGISSFLLSLWRTSVLIQRAVIDLAKTVKDAVQKQNMLAWQFNTIGVSDAITMGGQGLFYFLE